MHYYHLVCLLYSLDKLYLMIFKFYQPVNCNKDILMIFAGFINCWFVIYEIPTSLRWSETGYDRKRTYLLIFTKGAEGSLFPWKCDKTDRE